MPTVFITGIEGFVGTHLAKLLREQDKDVSGLYWNEPAPDLRHCQIERCDIRDVARLRSLLGRVRPAFIVHLAAISSVAVAERDMLEAIEINAGGTWSLLSSVQREAPRARVLLISSGEVYDQTPSEASTLHESSPVRPQSGYALTKLWTEELGKYFGLRYGMDIVILRPFSHTGPGQSRNFVFPSVAGQIAESEVGLREPVIEVGNLDVQRDYSDVRDICRAYSLALDRAVSSEIYNVTSEQLLRIGDGIDYLVSKARVPVRLVVSAQRQREERTVLAGSSAKFRAATAWKPEYDIRQTLADLLEFERLRVLRRCGMSVSARGRQTCTGGGNGT